MNPVKRLLGFVRPYTLRFFVAVILMAVVGACEALTALLIKPVFDNVLTTAAQSGSILLFTWAAGHRGVYLEDFLPFRIHNVWTMVAFAMVAVTIIKGLAEY